MSNTVNKIEAKLVLTSESSKAVSELQKVANQAKEVSKAAQDAQRKMGQMKGPSVPNMPEAQRSFNPGVAAAGMSARPSGGSGGFDAMAMFAGKAMVALAAVSSLTKAMEALTDTSKGTIGQLQGLASAIPVVGETGFNFGMAAAKFIDRKNIQSFQDEQRNTALAEVRGNAMLGRQQKMDAANAERFGIGSMANSMRPDSFLMPVDGEDERVTQAKYNERRAKRAADLAAQEAKQFGTVTGENQGNQLSSAELRSRVAQAQLDSDRREAQLKESQRESNFSSDSLMSRGFNVLRSARSAAVTMDSSKLTNLSPAASLAAEEKSIQSRSELGRTLLSQEQALRTAKEKQVAEAKALAEYERARTETMKAQAAVLKDQLASAKAAEKSFGMMNANDKQNVLSALRNAREKGFENVTEEERSLLAGNAATSKFAEKEAERIGGSDNFLSQIRGLTGDKSSSELANELKDLSAKIDVKIDVDENALADKFKTIMDAFISKLEVIVKRQTDNTVDQADANSSKQRTLQSLSLS